MKHVLSADNEKTKLKSNHLLAKKEKKRKLDLR